MSNREYKAIQGTKEAEHLKRFQQRKAGIFDDLLSLPSAKCAQLSDFTNHLLEMKKILPKVMEFQSKRKVRAFQLTRFIRKQKTVKQFCERLVGSKKSRGE